MSLIEIHFTDGSEDPINKLWSLMRLVRQLPDTPVLWKLTDFYLDEIGKFYNINDSNQILTLTFLDTSIDATSLNSRLICQEACYPLDLVEKSDNFH